MEIGDLLDYGKRNPKLKKWIDDLMPNRHMLGCPDIEIGFVVDQIKIEVCKLSGIDEEFWPVYGIIALDSPISLKQLECHFFDACWALDGEFERKDVKAAIELLLELGKIKENDGYYFV